MEPTDNKYYKGLLQWKIIFRNMEEQHQKIVRVTIVQWKVIHVTFAVERYTWREHFTRPNLTKNFFLPPVQHFDRPNNVHQHNQFL